MMEQDLRERMRLAARFAGQPVAMLPDALMALLAGDAPAPQSEHASRFAGAYDRDTRCSVTDDGIAVVPVHGTLIDRGAWLGSYWGMTSYEGLAEQFRRLADDAEVRAVVLDVDSGGGMVSGLFDLMPVLADLKSAKPVYAVANSCAASAAYAIACAADEVYVNRQGLAGSIGVIAVHASYAEMMAKYGIRTTLITAGKKKALGNRYQDLSAEDLAELQMGVDRTADTFFQHVADTRGLAIEAIRGQEARCFTGEEAVAQGLADGVKSFEETLEHIRATSRTRVHQPGGFRMPGSSGSAAPRADLTQALTEAVASLAANRQAPAADGISRAEAEALARAAADKAVSDDRGRIAAILDHAAAVGREGLARKLAFRGLDLAAAVEILEASPKATSPAVAAAVNPLAAEMARRSNSAGIAPEAAADAKGASAHRPPLGDVFASRFGGSKKKGN